MKRMTSWAALTLAASLLSFTPAKVWPKREKEKEGKKGDTEQVDGKKKGRRTV